LGDAVAVGVEDVDFRLRGDAGEKGLIVGYRGVNDDQFTAPLCTLVHSGAGAIFGRFCWLGVGVGSSSDFRHDYKPMIV